MKRNFLSIGLLVIFGVALAAAGSRVIEIEGGRQQGDLRFGPYKFTEGVKATVQKLQIASTEGSLTAPQGLEMSKAEGKRTAGFAGGVTVTRGRLTAKGPTLEYKEETGLGVLAGPTNIVQKSAKAGEDDVFITALKATFDVDTNISTSEGSVKLVNGKQSATSSKVVFDEEQNLGCLTDAKTVTLVREPKKTGDPKLVITAKEARVLTETNTLVAVGGVTLISGDNTTTGDALYYDDDKDTAWVVGNVAKNIPAKNVNKKSGATVSGGTIINYTKKNQIERQGTPFIIPFEKFKCASDK
jgi:lipopolysaccharide export system protein LptA